MPPSRAKRRLLAALLLVTTAVAARAQAQDAGQALPAPNARTGLDAHLSGDGQAFLGLTYALHGTAYEVHGLASLVALPGAHLHARFECDADDFTPAAWTDGVAGAGGRFALDV